jgi:hypothetical protein
MPAHDPFAFKPFANDMGGSSSTGQSCDPFGDEIGSWNNAQPQPQAPQKVVGVDPFASSTFQIQPQIQAPAAPSWVEPHATFCSNAPVESIFSYMKQALTKHCDIQADERTCQIRCIVYTPSRCLFHVNLYTSNGETLVEFQRRSGCVLTFNGLFNDMLNTVSGIISRMYASQQAFDPSQLTQNFSLNPAGLADFEDTTMDFGMPQQEFNNLLGSALDMMLNPYFEAQREGAQSLSFLLKEQGGKLNDQHVPLILAALPKLLEAMHQELIHSGAVCANQLLALVRERIPNSVSAFIPCLMRAMVAPNCLENRDTKRHASAALLTLSNRADLASQLVQYRSQLERCRNMDDETVRVNISQILSAI